MFRKTYLRIAGRLLALFVAAAVSVTCESVPEVPVGPTYPSEPPADGYVWREIPEIPENLPPTQESVVHFINVNGKKVRNFSLLYDTEQKVSYWVAYPMHSFYTTGNGKRLDRFAYDPYFSPPYYADARSIQMPIYGTNTYGISGLSRGHQIPSADRYVTQEANDQTFYITNMTPQNYSLNGGIWEDLESWVRAKSKTEGRSDTLYVVTGCAIKTPTDQNVDYITMRTGDRGAKPKAYYKVLLRTRSGRAVHPTDDDAMCIGMWFENEASSGGDKWQDHVMSVSDIEALTGHKFFPAISSEVKGDLSTSDWGIY